MYTVSVDNKAWLGLTSLALVMGLLLFVPAGTVHYVQAGGYPTVLFFWRRLSSRFISKHMIRSS